MKNIKKMAFALVLGLFAFGFSAFKSKEKQSIFLYYKVDMTYPAANNPNGYKYYDEDRCEPTGTLCTARWDIGSHAAPTNGVSLPLTGVTFQTNSVALGSFE